MKRFPVYLKLELKKGLKLIPSFLLSIVLTAAAAALAAAVFSAVMGERNILPKAVIAVVAGSDGSDDTVETSGMPDFKTMMAIGMIEGMDSIKSVCDLTYMSPKAAAEGLASGSVSAAVYLPEGIYEAIDTGENTPIKVRLASGGNELLSGLFRALAESGVTLIRTVETSIYAMDVLSETYTLTADLPVLEDAIFNTYLSGALSRVSVWNSENVSSRTTLSLRDFIITSAALLVLLLFGIGFRSFYTEDEKASSGYLARLGLPRSAMSAAKIIACTAVFLILTVILTTVFRLTAHAAMPDTFPAWSIWDALRLLPAAAAVSFGAAAFVHLIYILVPEKSSGLFYLLITVLLFTVCGGLLPAAYLPKVLRYAALRSPVAAWQNALSAVLFGSSAPDAASSALWAGRFTCVIPAVVWGVILLVPAAIATAVVSRKPSVDKDSLTKDAGQTDRLRTGSEDTSSKTAGSVLAGTAGNSPAAAHDVLSDRASAKRSGIPLLLRLRILLLRDLRSPFRWLVIGTGLLLFCVITTATLPSAANHTIGLVNGGGQFAEQTAADLTTSDSIFDYVLYPDRDALADAVVSGKVDCGFVLDQRIDEAMDSKKGGITFPPMDGCADYLFTTSTTKGEAAKEEVYSCLFENLSEAIMLHDVRTGAIFTDPDEEMASAFLEEMRKISAGDETFHVEYEYVDSAGSASGAAGTGGSSVWPVAVLMIFAAALLFAQTAFGTENTAVASFLRKSGFSFILLDSVSPLILFGAAVTIAAAVSGGSFTPRVLLLLPFLIVCALWAVLFTRLFRGNQTLCLFAAVAVILISAALSDGITGSAMIPGAVKYLRILLPGSWPVV